jgi:hypothetical protein
MDAEVDIHPLVLPFGILAGSGVVEGERLFALRAVKWRLRWVTAGRARHDGPIIANSAVCTASQRFLRLRCGLGATSAPVRMSLLSCNSSSEIFRRSLLCRTIRFARSMMRWRSLDPSSGMARTVYMNNSRMDSKHPRLAISCRPRRLDLLAARDRPVVATSAAAPHHRDGVSLHRRFGDCRPDGTAEGTLRRNADCDRSLGQGSGNSITPRASGNSPDVRPRCNTRRLRGERPFVQAKVTPLLTAKTRWGVAGSNLHDAMVATGHPKNLISAMERWACAVPEANTRVFPRAVRGGRSRADSAN